MSAEELHTDYEHHEQQDPVEVIFDTEVPLSETQKEVVRWVVKNFTTMYNLWNKEYPQGIRFSTFFVPWTFMGWWWNSQTAAKTEGNTIFFNSNKDYTTITDHELINIVRHELWHTLSSKHLSTEFVLSTWDKIQAIAWFKIHIITKDGVQTAFNLFEEAFCETIAVDQAAETWLSYSSDPRYFAVWWLMMDLCRHKDISLPELITYNKESTFFHFLNKVFWRETTFHDLEYMISKFNELRVKVTQLLTDSFQDQQLEKNLPNNISIIKNRIFQDIISRW